MSLEWDCPPEPGFCDRCGFDRRLLGDCGCLQLADVANGRIPALGRNGEAWHDLHHHAGGPQCEFCGAVWMDHPSGRRYMVHEDDCVFILVEFAYAESRRGVNPG